MYFNLTDKIALINGVGNMKKSLRVKGICIFATHFAPFKYAFNFGRKENLQTSFALHGD